MATMVGHRKVVIDDPPVERFVFSDTRFSHDVETGHRHRAACRPQSAPAHAGRR